MEDRTLYRATMKEASSAAWDHDWPRAIEAYRRALEAVPNDPQALAGLALSLMEDGQYREALAAYIEVSKLVPSDPLPREKIGEILARLGKAEEAARQFLNAGEIYLARKEIAHAIECWEQAVSNDIDLAQAHMRLAVTYEGKTETRQQAVYEFMQVARLMQKQNQVPRAEQALQRALNLDPINSVVRDALDDLKRGKIIQAISRSAGPALSGQEQTDLTEEDDLLAAVVPGKESYPPVETATRYAMGLLADAIWSGETPTEAQAPLLHAIDAHQMDDANAAVNSYLKARAAGLDHPALHFLLGVLHLHQRRFEEAINALRETSQFSEYAVASYILLGQAYFTQDNIPAAAISFLEAVRQADSQLNLQEVDEGGYSRMIGSLEGQSENYLAEFVKAIAFYLDTADWQEKLSKALENYRDESKVSYVPDLIELIIEGGRPEISEIMRRVDMYMQRNMLHLATEEAHYAIERVPDYLPAHRRLADILIREARAQEAATKLNLIANTYLVRGNADKAADLFAEVINLWPADTRARQRVIDMLRSQGRVAEALHHYADMADLFYRMMADPEQAIAVYTQALAYAREANADPHLIIPTLKALADIESQRLNWRKALLYYERILDISPGDEEVALSAIDLHFQLNETGEAVRTLDNYIRHCIAGGESSRILPVLEDQVRRHPDVVPLRQRLAEVYRQQGRIQDAITHLDALGELFLDVGNMEEALNTIRKIVALNPPDVEGYRQLLRNLESGRQP